MITAFTPVLNQWHKKCLQKNMKKIYANYDFPFWQCPVRKVSNSGNLNPLVPDRTLKYVFSKKSFPYFFSHNTSISYPILKI